MASKPLKGYKRLPGSAHHYLTPSGVEITEYQYRSRKARRYKGADGKSVFKNYSAQRRFREKQDFLALRFKIRTMDPYELMDAGSDLEGALAEAMHRPDFGRSGIKTEAENTRAAQIMAKMGAPDYYFWRFWYSETRA
jgi:hypothetical protein